MLNDVIIINFESSKIFSKSLSIEMVVLLYLDVSKLFFLGSEALSQTNKNIEIETTKSNAKNLEIINNTFFKLLYQIKTMLFVKLPIQHGFFQYFFALFVVLEFLLSLFFVPNSKRLPVLCTKE